MGTELTRAEQRKLADLEAVIEGGVTSFMAVGRALIDIREEQLYIAAANTFEDYCRKRWGFGRAHAYRLITAYEAADDVSPIGDIGPPKTESVARELAKLPTAQARADVWQGVANVCETEKRKPTAKMVRNVSEKLHPVPVPEVEYETCPTCGRKKKL